MFTPQALRGLSLILTFIFAGTIAAETQAPRVVKAEDLRALIESGNQNYAARLGELKAAREREGALKRSFIPSIHVFAAQERFRHGDSAEKTEPTYGARISLPLYRGGLDRLEDRLLTKKRENVENELKLQRIEFLSEARELFWQIRFNQEKKLALENSLKMNEAHRAAAERRIRSGVATQSDRLEFEMRGVELKQEKEQTEFQIRRDESLLRLVLGIPSGTPLKIESTYDHEHDWRKEVEHTPNDHEVFSRVFEVNSEILDLEAAKNRASLRPQISIFTEWQQMNDRAAEWLVGDDKTENVLGLRLDWSWDDIGQKRAESRALLIEAEAQNQRSKFEKDRIEAHVKTEIEELQLLHSQLHAAEEVIRSSESYERLTQNEYRRGVKNSPDVLGASEKLLASRLRYLEIIRNFQVARGHLLARLDR